MCALLYSDWKRLVPEQSIPVYTPYSDAPLAFWFIYKNTETGEVDSAYAWDIRQAWSLLWFRAGLFADMKYTANTKNMYDRTNFSAPPVGQYGMEAYTESLKEPFRSAPMLQMYVYMGKPLLVARDESGAVQHVYFQQRNIENPMERARLYLGDKWYRP